MEEKRNLKIIQTLINVAILLLGLLGSSVFDYFTKQVLSPEKVIVVLLPIIGLIIVIVSAMAIQRYYQQTSKSIEKIANSVSVTIDLLSYSDRRKAQASIEEIIGLIKNANKGIMILDNAPWTANVNSYYPADWLNKYYEALNKYIDAGNPYVRIIQMPDQNSTIIETEDIKSPIALSHFKKVLEKNSFINSRCALMKSKIFLPKVTFIIIDEQYIIWEIPIVDLQNKLQFANDFLINDRDGKLVGELTTLLKAFEHEATKITSIE